MNDKHQGLYAKYKPIERTDAPNPKHKDCQYFVLDLTHDPYARKAAKVYAIFCSEEHPTLASDLVALAVSLEKTGE